MRSEKEIENKFMQMGMIKSKNSDNYWYKIGFSEALLYCLGKEIENSCFKNPHQDFLSDLEIKLNNKILKLKQKWSNWK